MLDIHLESRRPGLLIPTHKLIKITPRDLCHRGDELVNRHCLTIVTRKVQITALSELTRAKQGVNHANDFCALLIDRECVKIRDLLVLRRLDGVCYRTGIFGKLSAPEEIYVLNPLHGS